MSKAKENWKKFWVNVWETIKSSFILVTFFGILSGIAFIGTINKDWCGPIAEGFNGKRIAFLVVIAVLLAAYAGAMAFGFGGKGYQMLVSGNMKRMSAEQLGTQMKISSHKEEMEYREWKGFAIGGVIAFFTVLFGILVGINGDGVNEAFRAIAAESEEAAPFNNKGVAILTLISMLCCGWSLLPFAYLNVSGIAVSYFWSCLFGLLPIIVAGIFYIVGAYAARGKSLRAQENADRAAEEEANKPRKINYGGLPGTKPKKRK